MSVSLNIEEFFSLKQSIIEIYPICNVAARFETSGVYVVIHIARQKYSFTIQSIGKIDT